MVADSLASPGHKLGQIIGVLLEDAVGKPVRMFAENHGFFCDQKGDRPGVRQGKKVTWNDSRGNPHDLDFVLERNGALDRKGDPVAFIETAWRRYTKHSRNKSGEIEGALLPLRETYPTVRFLGVILAGEYSSGGVQQLRSAGIEVLHIPFSNIADAFRIHGLEIDYPEKATPAQKASLNRALENLSDVSLRQVANSLWEMVATSYAEWEKRLLASVTEEAARVRIFTLYGDEKVYSSVQSAIEDLEFPKMARELNLDTPRGYELFVDYPSGARVSGRFQTKLELIQFLKRIAA